MKRTLFPTHAIFHKALILFSLFILMTTSAYSQGPKWTTLGNITSTGDFIGSTNFEPLTFKTNNITRGTFTASGDFQLNNLIGIGTRLVATDANGNIIPFTMGNPGDVLYGDGTWGGLPLMPAELWISTGSDIYYNGKVGIGTSTPAFPLDVIGNVRISNNLYVGGGIIISDKVNANAEVVTGKMIADSIVTDSTKGFYGTTKFNGDIKLSSRLNVDGNTIIGGNLTAGSVSSPNISTTDFNVANLLSANKISAYRITGQLGDSLIRFGDSTIWINTSLNRIYATSITTSGTTYGGLAIGTLAKAYGTQSLALGTNAVSSGTQSIAIGAGMSTNALRAICIGASGSGTSLTNNIPNSFMLAFASDIPTLFVSSGSGTGTSGNVSIGGNTNPTYKFQVESGNTDAFLLKTTSAAGLGMKVEVNSNTNQAIVIENSGVANFKVFGDGKVYAREVNVQLGTFPDYVFYKNYKLNKLSEVDDFIRKNHHLPNIPSAEDVKQNGIGIGELQLKLLEKVEEITLYLLEQDKKLKQLEQENSVLKKQVSELKK